MAETVYGVNAPESVKLWSKRLAVEVSKATPIASLIGTGSNSVIQLKDETQKGAGDRVTVTLRRQLHGDGVTEHQVLEGNEESLETFTQDVYINELAHAVRVRAPGTIDEQRVPFDMRQEANDALVDWYADRLSMAAFIQWGGYTAPTMTFEGRTVNISAVHYGFNAPSAPSSGRIIRSGAVSNDQSLGSTNVFTLDLIDKAVELAKTANPKIRPIRVAGENKYILYLHPQQVTSLRTNTNAGQWLDIQKAVYMGSKMSNPIYDGSLGEYNGCILREAEHVTPGVNGSTGAEISTVRRAVLLGAQSMVAAFGRANSPTRYTTVEELFDYRRSLGVAAKTNMGFIATKFNSVDYGKIVISTYATAAA